MLHNSGLQGCVLLSIQYGVKVTKKVDTDTIILHSNFLCLPVQSMKESAPLMFRIWCIDAIVAMELIMNILKHSLSYSAISASLLLYHFLPLVCKKQQTCSTTVTCNTTAN